MNNKGFTLVELLAAIVILALLGFIASTSVTQVVKNSKSDLYNTQLESIKIAAEAWGKENIDKIPDVGSCRYLTLKVLKDYGILKDKVINPKTNTEFSDELKIKITSSETEFGGLNIEYEVAAKNTNDCEFVYPKICEAVTEENKTTGNIPKGAFTPGDEYICEVAPQVKYYFFVLGEENNKVNLILNKNISNDGSAIDNVILNDANLNIPYNLVGWQSSGNYMDGPQTALNFLNVATKGWVNIPNLNETYQDENIDFTTLLNGSNGYGKVELNEKARLPKFSDLYGEGKCSSLTNCPLWLTNYLNGSPINVVGMNGYWLLSSYSADEKDKAWIMSNSGLSASDSISINNSYGIRPIISLHKYAF